jgi:hypothetical protein
MPLSTVPLSLVRLAVVIHELSHPVSQAVGDISNRAQADKKKHECSGAIHVLWLYLHTRAFDLPRFDLDTAL